MNTPDPTNSPRLRALVVEDDEEQRELLTTFLLHLGHEVICAETGSDALLLFAEQRPDFVLMDILLPGMDGFEATARMASDAGGDWVPVIYLTVMKQRASLIAGLNAGGHDYIVKPIDLDVLEAKLGALVKAINSQIRLRSAEALLDMVFDPCENAALGFTGDGIVIAANDGAVQLFGRERKALRGQHANDLLAGADLPQTAEDWLRRADGEPQPVEALDAKGARLPLRMRLYARPVRSRQVFLAVFAAAT